MGRRRSARTSYSFSLAQQALALALAGVVSTDAFTEAFTVVAPAS
jgi:hypothetical protein